MSKQQKISFPPEHRLIDKIFITFKIRPLTPMFIKVKEWDCHVATEPPSLVGGSDTVGEGGGAAAPLPTTSLMIPHSIYPAMNAKFTRPSKIWALIRPRFGGRLEIFPFKSVEEAAPIAETRERRRERRKKKGRKGLKDGKFIATKMRIFAFCSDKWQRPNYFKYLGIASSRKSKAGRWRQKKKKGNSFYFRY